MEFHLLKWNSHSGLPTFCVPSHCSSVQLFSSLSDKWKCWIRFSQKCSLRAVSHNAVHFRGLVRDCPRKAKLAGRLLGVFLPLAACCPGQLPAPAKLAVSYGKLGWQLQPVLRERIGCMSQQLFQENRRWLLYCLPFLPYQYCTFSITWETLKWSLESV